MTYISGFQKQTFQAFVVKKNAKMKDSYPLNINDLNEQCKMSWH